MRTSFGLIATLPLAACAARPGIYHVTARSPAIVEVTDGTSRQTSCAQPVTVTVVPRQTAKIALLCIVP